jgi:hypothetical protein
MVYNLFEKNKLSQEELIKLKREGERDAKIRENFVKFVEDKLKQGS